MPYNPNIRKQVVRGPMANVSTLEKNSEYIADQVFPIIDNCSIRTKIAQYEVADWMRDDAQIRAPGTEASRSGFGINYTNIDPVQYAHAMSITQEEIDAQNMDGAPPTNLVQDAIMYTSDKINLKKEIRTAALIFEGTWNGSTVEDADGKWVASSGNTFFADIRTRQNDIQTKTGHTANTLAIDYKTFLLLKEVDEIQQKIKYTQRSIMTEDILASLLGLDKVLVGKAIQNTAAETDPSGAQTLTAQSVWEVNAGKGGAFLFYRPPSAGLRQVSAGYQCRVKQSTGSGRLTRFWHEESKDQWVYETREETDISQINANAGFAWKDINAT